MKYSSLRVPVFIVAIALVAWAIPSTAQSPAEGVQEIKARMTIFHVLLKDDHRFGLEMPSAEMEDLVADSGIPAFGRALEEFGETRLAAQVEAQGIVGSNIRGFSGSEQPYVTTFLGGDAQGGVRSTTQQTITGGTTLDITFTERGNRLLGEYSVNYDNAYLKKVEDLNLIARLRTNIAGTMIVSPGKTTYVVRQAHTAEDQPQELIFIIEIE